MPSWKTTNTWAPAQEWDLRLFTEVYHNHPSQINSQRPVPMIVYPVHAAHTEKQLSTNLYSKGGETNDEENRNSI